MISFPLQFVFENIQLKPLHSSIQKLTQASFYVINYQTLIMSKKVKIAHSLQELEDQVILTLVDRPLLNKGQLQEDEDDVLQNDEMQINNEAKHNVELRSKLKNIADASSSHLQAKNEGISGILPHYDDHSFKPNTIEVKEGQFLKPKKLKKNRELGNDYQQNDTTTTKLNSEYGSRRQFKKVAVKTSARDLLNFLDQTAQDNLHQVKKEDDNIDIVKDSLDQLKKKRILDGSIKSIVQNQVVEDQEQSYLFKAIQRSRKKAEAHKFNILEAIKEEEVDQHQNEKEKIEIELNPISYKSSDNIRQDRKVELKEALGGTASVMFATLPSERLAKKVPKESEQKIKFEDFSKEELEKMRAQVEFLEDKEVGLGLAGTLAYLRENSLLGKEEQVGRHTDKTISYNDPNDKIKLQYRNASGKLMKPKEAYRYICAKFHGEGPSKNKVQIRKKRELEELRVKQNLNQGGKLMSMLEQHQQKSNEAHLVLNLGSKGGSQK